MKFRDLASARRRLRRRLLDPLVDWRNARRREPRVVFVHVGPHKTGSSVIQALLKSESDRLRHHGFFHDPEFYRLGRTLVRQSPLGADERTTLQRRFDARLRARPEPNIVGSSESLFGDPFASYGNIGSVAEDLRRILEGHDVRIVACIRRQDEFVQSLYHQHVKQGGTQRFEAFLQSHDLHAFRWDELLGEYARVFGRANLTVCCYDIVFREGADLLASVFPQLRAAGFRGRSRAEVLNPALSGKGLEMAIRCNDLLTPDEHRVFRRFLQDAFPRRQGEPHGLFSPKQRQELLDYYAASNRRCFEEFLGAAPHDSSFWLGRPEQETVGAT
jgi:hypothetical protein